MKNLLALAAIVLIAYYVYTSGILTRAVQSNLDTVAVAS
jgi:hypothetical protein